MRDWQRVLTTLVFGVLIAAYATACSAQDAAADESPADEAAEVASEAEVAAAADGDGHDADGHEEAHGDHAGHEDHPASAPDPLATDPDLALWTLGVFVAMLLILSQVAWEPIMKALKAREENIGGAIAEAQQKLEDAKGILAQHEAHLAGAADQVRELLAEAHRDAETTVAQAKANAKAEFEAERDRAMRDIDQAKDAAVRSLAERTAGLAIDLAGRVVKQDITPARQSEIVREALGRFSSNGPSAN
ncbi:ATP synthase subunit b, sodium ion specific [Botrimarina colliarenosi]|uniref:ATP synthase subunit b n=1 Tax=Botrimarina colliarenosi TaxID=2528001 RepID=A0A5C6A1J3_9BACT|nr:F0F1 ATP synthase subunit B [Botrimarina colliarenosi]TWT93439.1 ATP synthase subunit b, sodium ion specific [Botrimarina colliarenosi]